MEGDVERVLHMCVCCPHCRGRGSVGSRMDEEGPFMLPPPEGAELYNEDVALYRRQPVGPAKPRWLHAEPGPGGARGGSGRDGGTGAGVIEAGGDRRERRSTGKGEKKRKRKKEKGKAKGKERSKERRHKHKRRRHGGGA